MNNIKKFPWLWFVAIVAGILFILNFSQVLHFFVLLWHAMRPLVLGACLAFLINLIMDPLEGLFKKYGPASLVKASRGLALLLSILILLAIFTGLCFLVIPQLIDSIQLLFKLVPTYVKDVQEMLVQLFKDRPDIAKDIDSLNINWEDVFQKVAGFLTRGLEGAMDSTFSIISSVASGTVNGIIMIIFAIYVLCDKERFVMTYHRICRLWFPKKEQHITYIFVTLYDSFKNFVVGQCIEAIILGVTITVGMMVLKLPYPAMIGTMVGVTNIIPMIGAFIGGGIGWFLVFTVSPVQSLIFLVYLCVVQQIESNVLYPRIVGNSIGLPGIYVTMVVVVGGSLAGIPGMIIGIPLVAAIYRLVTEWFDRKEMKAGIVEGPEDLPDHRGLESSGKPEAGI